MHFASSQNRQTAQAGVWSTGQLWRLHRGWIFAGLVALAVLVCTTQSGAQTATTTPPSPSGPPDKNPQLRMQQENESKKQADYAAASGERKKQLADDSSKLLKLAADLKAEVDKSDKDTLSITVIRKADEIERLAHSVREKMKLTAGSN